MANRILKAAATTQALLDGKSAGVRARLEQATLMTLEETMTYQAWQSRAHAMGILSPEEAQTIYNALGGEGAHWADDASLALRLTVMRTMVELGKALLTPAQVA